MPDAARRHSPAAERNARPIAAELLRLLPPSGLLLEIASGTGQHAACFAAAMPGWRFMPTDHEAASLPSIAAWCANLANVLAPITLDVLSAEWRGVPTAVDAVFCANMIHIAPWACCGALMRGAARHLSNDGALITYGPYLEAGVATSPGNVAFDADLRARNAEWGLRRVDDVAMEAAAAGFELRERITMPANNLLLVWRFSDAARSTTRTR